MFKHRKIIKKGAAAVTTMPGIYLTNYSRVEIFIANIQKHKEIPAAPHWYKYKQL